MPPRPLHRQVLMSRSIVVAEEMELHLVWSKNRLFIKPVPAYLLDPDFWTSHLLSGGGESVADRQNDLAACARRFLFSYTALISYASDFTIACQCGLLPSSVSWAGWKTLCAQLLSSHCYSAVDPRYWYGELRLSRLNKVDIFRKGFVLRGYSSVGGHAMYDDLLRDNFTALAAALGYVVIVLTAMQVVLATGRLQPNRAFQNASFGFSVFGIIAPIIAAAGIVAVVLSMFVSNWAATERYESRRFREMGVEPFWQGGKQSGGSLPSR